MLGVEVSVVAGTTGSGCADWALAASGIRALEEMTLVTMATVPMTTATGRLMRFMLAAPRVRMSAD
jgi:hypothetical protein